MTSGFEMYRVISRLSSNRTSIESPSEPYLATVESPEVLGIDGSPLFAEAWFGDDWRAVTWQAHAQQIKQCALFLGTELKGGERAAIAAAKAGKRVGVAERRTVVGGVCVNTGTIPSKSSIKNHV